MVYSQSLNELVLKDKNINFGKFNWNVKCIKFIDTAQQMGDNINCSM